MATEPIDPEQYQRIIAGAMTVVPEGWQAGFDQARDTVPVVHIWLERPADGRRGHAYITPLMLNDVGHPFAAGKTIMLQLLGNMGLHPPAAGQEG